MLKRMKDNHIINNNNDDDNIMSRNPNSNKIK